MKNFKLQNARNQSLQHNQSRTNIYKLKSAQRIFSTSILLLLLVSTGCKKDLENKEENRPEITNKVNVVLPTDPGEVGLVIDTREIFRKGFIATKAEVKFPEHPGFNQTLDIDPILNIATLRISNESLTEVQKAAFKSGVNTDIVIKGEGEDLAHYTNKKVLDNSGDPLTLRTEKPRKILPVILKENVSYYVQPETIGGDGSFPAGAVLKSYSPELYDFRLPEPNSFNFKYYFKPVSGTANTYYILRAANDPPQFTPKYYFYVNTSSTNHFVDVTEEASKASKFVFEQDADGWARIYQSGTNKYMTILDATASTSTHWKGLYMKPGTGNRFRIISDNINWSTEDRGTVYQQPIMPPSEIEFAYQSTIKNCSSGTLTETVGLTKSKKSVRSLETSESLQLFSSAERSWGFKVGAEVGGDVGVAEVKATAEFSLNRSYTTSSTITTENKVSDSYEVTSEVSRTRTLEVRPNTGVEVYDAVRVVKNPRTPFTQVVRLKANYKNGTPLSGTEIMTQLKFNFIGGVPTKIGGDYVEVSIRGQIIINEMFETETGAKDVANACN